jgi:hypothetical protein
MTSRFVPDFEDRKRQIRHYLAVVSSVERSTKIGKSSRAQERRLLTLRAGTFLMLYNLVEASTRGAIETIHDQIVTEQVPFGQLTEQLRRETLKKFRLPSDLPAAFGVIDFPIEFVTIALDQEIKLSGNVDAKFIRKLGECYGFSCESDKGTTWGGSDLLTIKTNRNDLSHGRKTYEEVGRDYPFRELLALTRRALFFMSAILANVDDYLESKSYRTAAAA